MVAKRALDERHALVTFIATVMRSISSQARDGGQLAASFSQVRVDHVPLVGLRMAAGDLVEWCVDLTGEQLADLDAELEAAGAPTLTAMRRSGYRKVLAILGRGRIRSETDWQLLNNLLSDTADRTLNAVERECAEQLVHTYEMNRRKQ